MHPQNTLCTFSPAGAGLVVGCPIEEVYYSIFSVHLTLLLHLMNRLHLDNRAHRTAHAREEHLLTFRARYWVTPLTWAQGSTLNTSTACGEGYNVDEQWLKPVDRLKQLYFVCHLHSNIPCVAWAVEEEGFLCTILDFLVIHHLAVCRSRQNVCVVVCICYECACVINIQE